MRFKLNLPFYSIITAKNHDKQIILCYYTFEQQEIKAIDVYR